MMNEMKRRGKFYFMKWHTLGALLCGVIGALILIHGIPGAQYFKAFPMIPIYFYLWGLLSIYLFDYGQRQMPKKILLIYLGIKSVKMILSILLLIVFTILDPEDGHVFLLTFVAFYLVYLVFETWLFFSFEKMIKGKYRIEQ